MRHAAALAPLLLFACSGGESVEERIVAAKASEDGIDCALAGAARFERACMVERGRDGSLTVRHPDGGFRRLLVADDGRGVAAADGAAEARVQVVGRDRIEVAIGRDRYRLPATVKAGSASPR